ncbi:MAG: HesA/MoeB/ThiF family protein [Pseudomonadota bacterium]
MMLVFGLAAGLWGLGAALRTPQQARLLMIGLLWVGVVSMHILLPAGHPLRNATGGSAAFWVYFAIFVALAFSYGKGVHFLKEKADRRNTPEQKGPFSEAELDRYARHIMLREIGGPGQKALKDAKVLVVGAGGLGSPALLYLGAAGVGTLSVIDDDLVDNSNLQRQVIHRDKDIGRPKVQSAYDALCAQNPNIDVRSYTRRLTAEIAEELFAEYDLVLDGSDNFETRYLVNAAAVATETPLVSGALSQWEGQLSLFDPANGGPCYACVFPEPPAVGLAPTCAEAGVFSPLAGIVGCMMAAEAIKYLAEAGETLQGQLLIYDALYGESRRMKINRRADCPVCGVVDDVKSA